MGTLKLKTGLKANLPAEASLGEPLFCTDTNELYMGKGSGQTLAPISSSGLATLSSNGLMSSIDKTTFNYGFKLPGIDWYTRSPAINNNWTSVAYGNGVFVAIAWQLSGSNVIMYSLDKGETWTSSTASAQSWTSVCYGNGKFVAVSTGSSAVATSTDGINWSVTTGSLPNQSWNDVCYGNGLYVVVAQSGTGSRVATSPDGVTWTPRTSADYGWKSVIYGNGTFVAVSLNGTNRAMTSTDGTNWVLRATADDTLGWVSVCYGNGLFVAVTQTTTGSTGGAMYSTNGINWTSSSSMPSNINWRTVTYGNGMFVALSNSTGDKLATSTDGINWTTKTLGLSKTWNDVTYGEGTLVAVTNASTSYVDSVLISHVTTYNSNFLNGKSSNDFIPKASVVPTTATSPGVAGTVCFDSNYVYFCVATDTWKRVAIATW